MRFVLALDQGTTSSRAILFDETGSVRGLDQREFAQYFPREGWVEHDPADIWQTQLATARGALASAGVTAADVAALGITNQRETAILWDRRTGVPIAPAIVWQDRRTAGACEQLRAAGHSAAVAAKTGLRLDPYFSATKIAWLLDAIPGARERAERGELAFGTVDTWLIWNLTSGAVHATDHTNASRTLLLDLATLEWNDELLALFRVPRAVLPELRPSIGSFGSTEASLFGQAIPICGVAGDQQAALFGQAGFRPGLAKNTYGTGSFVLLNTGERIAQPTGGLLATVAFTSAGRSPCYALEGSIFVTGAAVQWLRDGLQIVESSDAVEALAAKVPDNGGVYFVPALAGLGAPYWDPYARGAIFGITRGTTRAHFARAALEAMAYQTADVLEVMARDAGLRLRELRVDGGASKDGLAMQFVADILGVDVVRPRVTETTALGAACMAVVGGRRMERPRRDRTAVDARPAICAGHGSCAPRRVAARLASRGPTHADGRRGRVNRAAMLARLASERFDILVIGGGATGLGCAVDAASRGYRTALVEANDFAAATSSRSTKLVHGGVRYLQEGDVHLVREALHERTHLLRNAPMLVADRAFLTPAYRWWEPPYYFTGLKLYDVLAGRSEFGGSRYVSRAETLDRLPWLRRSGLRCSIEYHDGQFDDARLAIALARTAADCGAAIANYSRVVSLLRAGSRLSGASVRDEESGAAFVVQATVTIDAAGIFSDEIRRLDDPAAPPILAHSRGTHVLVGRDTMPGVDALLVPKTADGRVLFAIPWHERMLIGTTDVPVDRAVLDPQPSVEEIAYLLDTVNEYVERPLGAGAVTASFAGLRPLVERGAVSTAKESREHLVETSRSGLVTIAGGKWTTYRKMAQDAVDAAIASGGLKNAACITATLRLHDDTSDELRALTMERPELAKPLHAGFSYTMADVVNGYRSEMARTPDDILARRTRLAFLDAAATAASRADVLAIQNDERL